MKKIKNHIKKYEYTNRMLEEADVEIKIIEKYYHKFIKIHFNTKKLNQK